MFLKAKELAVFTGKKEGCGVVRRSHFLFNSLFLL
jgi:hypothetical protein